MHGQGGSLLSLFWGNHRRNPTRSERIEAGERGSETGEGTEPLIPLLVSLELADCAPFVSSLSPRTRKRLALIMQPPYIWISSLPPGDKRPITKGVHVKAPASSLHPSHLALCLSYIELMCPSLSFSLVVPRAAIPSNCTARFTPTPGSTTRSERRLPCWIMCRSFSVSGFTNHEESCSKSDAVSLNRGI